MTIDTTALLKSFQENGGWYDGRIFGLKPFEGMGIGAVALEDIKVGDTVYSSSKTILTLIIRKTNLYFQYLTRTF